MASLGPTLALQWILGPFQLSANREILPVGASLLRRGLERLLPDVFLKQPIQILIFWTLVFYSLLPRFGQNLFQNKTKQKKPLLKVFMGRNYVLFVFNQIQDCFWAESLTQTQTGEPINDSTTHRISMLYAGMKTKRQPPHRQMCS